MMKYYKWIYGGGTHAVRVANLIISSMWLFLVILNISKDLQVDLPPFNYTDYNILGLCLLLSIFFTGLSFFIHGFEGGAFRFFSLTSGALSQFILTASYQATFPPFSTTVLFTSITGFWFLGGAFYIHKDRVMGGTGVFGDSD